MRRIVHPSRAQRTSRNTSPPTRHPRRGAALHIAAAIVALGAVAYMGVTSVMPTSSTVSASKKLKYLTPPTAIEVDASLGELGLTPKVLAAAGLSAEQTASFAGAAATYMRDHIADYRVAQDSVGQYRNESASLERLVRGGPPSQELLASLSTARSNLASAIAARQAVLDAAMADAGAQISAPALALLNTARANHRAWDVSEVFLGDSRNEHDWVALRDALANDRISAKLGVDPNSACHQLILDAQATPNASNAIANVSNLPDITASWNSAMGYQ